METGLLTCVVTREFELRTLAVSVIHQAVEDDRSDKGIAEKFLPMAKLLFDVGMVELRSYRWETNWEESPAIFSFTLP